MHAVASGDSGFGWVTWSVVLVASLIGSVLTTAQILAAMVLTDGAVSRAQVREMFGLDYAVTIAGTATALVCAIVWIDHPEAAPLLLIPTVIAFACYRAYIRERERHEKVKTLYATQQTLSESPEVAVALESLLKQALEAFNAERAEVILFADEGGAPLRTSFGPGTTHEAMAPIDVGAALALRTCAVHSGAAVALSAPFPGALGPYLQSREVRHGMLGVLRGEDRVMGTIMLANRFGLTRGFTDHDRALFETLAVNASVALQYDRNEHAVAKLHDLQRPAAAPGAPRPAHRAGHPLTVQPAGA